MESLKNYNSEDEQDVYKNYHRKRETNAAAVAKDDGRRSHRKSTDDTNYETIHMELSEDSQDSHNDHHKQKHGKSDGNGGQHQQQRRNDHHGHHNEHRRENSSSSSHRQNNSDEYKSSKDYDRHRSRDDKDKDRDRSRKDRSERDRERDKYRHDRRDRDDHRDSRRDRSERGRKSDRPANNYSDTRRNRSRSKDRKERKRNSRSRSRSHERASKFNHPMSRFERDQNKAEQLKKMGIELAPPSHSSHTPLIPPTTAAIHSAGATNSTTNLGNVKAKLNANIDPDVPMDIANFTAPILVSQRYTEQMQKRKLLWSNKKNAVAATVPTNNPPTTTNKWETAKFSQDTDGKVQSKFLRLMGMKDAPPTNKQLGVAEQETNSGPPDMVKKQNEMFSTMEHQYEVARQVTHTMRGMGLGFGTQPRQF